MSHSNASLHTSFLRILPRIRTHGQVYFRSVDKDKREELISEMVALCWRWFVRLAENGKDATLFPSALATFAARAVRGGRRCAGQERARDVLSSFAQQLHGFTVGTLPERDTPASNLLIEALADNTCTPPPDAAAFRCDFPAWRRTRSERDRRLIDELMVGERPQHLARKYGISRARVSQLRRDFHDDWQRFCGEGPEMQQGRVRMAA